MSSIEILDDDELEIPTFKSRSSIRSKPTFFEDDILASPFPNSSNLHPKNPTSKRKEFSPVRTRKTFNLDEDLLSYDSNSRFHYNKNNNNSHHNCGSDKIISTTNHLAGNQLRDEDWNISIGTPKPSTTRTFNVDDVLEKPFHEIPLATYNYDSSYSLAPSTTSAIVVTDSSQDEKENAYANKKRKFQSNDPFIETDQKKHRTDYNLEDYEYNLDIDLATHANKKGNLNALHNAQKMAQKERERIAKQALKDIEKQKKQEEKDRIRLEKEALKESEKQKKSSGT